MLPQFFLIVFVVFIDLCSYSCFNRNLVEPSLRRLPPDLLRLASRLFTFAKPPAACARAEPPFCLPGTKNRIRGMLMVVSSFVALPVAGSGDQKCKPAQTDKTGQNR
jgi:hypothetical protein